MKFLYLALTLAIYLPSARLFADDSFDMSFDSGSVLIRCGTPPGTDNHINNKLFNAAFPDWITSLQIHANEGRVARAHYLGVLKEGVFIVVVGDNRETALSNSEQIMRDLEVIMEKAIDETGDTPPFTAKDACLVSEIGPVAILPM